MKRLMIIVACLMMAACTTTAVRKTEALRAPEAGARILLVEPRIQLSLLTAGGAPEPRAEWSQAAREHLQRHIQTSLSRDNHQFITGNTDDLMEGRLGQVVRLNEAVTAAIIAHEYTGYLGQKLPTKTDQFDWTVGEGAQLVGEHFKADYALFV